MYKLDIVTFNTSTRLQEKLKHGKVKNNFNLKLRLTTRGD